MTTLTPTEIRSYASKAGFTGKNLDIAIAVALAESGGVTTAHNTAGRDNSYGLWQINMLGDMGPDRRKRFGLKSNSELLDPTTNARAAHMIWKSEGWQPWTTYTSGKYKKYLTGSQGGDSTDAKTVSAPTGGLNPITGIGAAINALSESFMKGFASIGAVIVAVALLVLGMVIIMRGSVASLSPTSKLGSVAKIAKKVST